MSAGWALVLVAVLIAANGMFVAFEFGLVAARRGVLEERAAAGRPRRRGRRRAAAQHLVRALGGPVRDHRDLAGGRLPGRGRDRRRRGHPLLELLGVGEGGRDRGRLALAFAVSTVLQMLLGELAPKNLALALPEAAARALSRPMRVFGVVLRPDHPAVRRVRCVADTAACSAPRSPMSGSAATRRTSSPGSSRPPREGGALSDHQGAAAGAGRRSSATGGSTRSWSRAPG